MTGFLQRYSYIRLNKVATFGTPGCGGVVTGLTLSAFSVVMIKVVKTSSMVCAAVSKARLFTIESGKTNAKKH